MQNNKEEEDENEEKLVCWCCVMSYLGQIEKSRRALQRVGQHPRPGQQYTARVRHRAQHVEAGQLTHGESLTLLFTSLSLSSLSAFTSCPLPSCFFTSFSGSDEQSELIQLMHTHH